MKITVILCTYNRCEGLAKALDSAAALRLPELVEWEVLVVDNNSRDRTREVVEAFSRRYGERFRYLFEPQQGKSHALNAGIREARGDILAFTDDDVTLEPTWLENLTAHLHENDWVGAGGRVLPDRTIPVPRWLSLKEEYARAPLALFDFGHEAGQLAEPPSATTWRFEKRCLKSTEAFEPTWVHAPAARFAARIQSSAADCSPRESGCVTNHLPSSIIRCQTAGFVKSTSWLGGSAKLARIFGNSGFRPTRKWFVAGIPLYLFRRLAVWTLRWMTAFPPERRFACKLKVWGLVGSIVESRSRDVKHPRDKRKAQL